MEPVKFEEQAKQQLQKREITPSAESWSKLEQRLEAQEEHKKFNFWWIGAVAAVAVIFFFLGSFFGDQTVVTNHPAVVETSSEKVPDEMAKENLQSQKEKIQVASEEVKAEAEKVLKPERVQQLPQKKASEALAIASEKAEKSKASEEASEVAFLEPQVNLQQASEEKKVPAEVSDAEVEALLMLASAEIEADPAYAEKVVDSRELLEEVEDELEASFRDKVFEVIRDGLVKAKTAVANRNF